VICPDPLGKVSFIAQGDRPSTVHVSARPISLASDVRGADGTAAEVPLNFGPSLIETNNSWRPSIGRGQNAFGVECMHAVVIHDPTECTVYFLFKPFFFSNMEYRVCYESDSSTSIFSFQTFFFYSRSHFSVQMDTNMSSQGN
jgi:hypothetical protein